MDVKPKSWANVVLGTSKPEPEAKQNETNRNHGASMIGGGAREISEQLQALLNIPPIGMNTCTTSTHSQFFGNHGAVESNSMQRVSTIQPIHNNQMFHNNLTPEKGSMIMNNGINDKRYLQYQNPHHQQRRDYGKHEGRV